MKVSQQDFIFLKKTLKENTKTKILSSSMEPFIYKNEIIDVSPVRAEDLKVGDVLVFWRNDKLICHMLTNLESPEKDSVITKGINNSKFDKPVHKDMILGIVVKPKLGIVKRFIFKLYLRFKVPSK